jgi:hypothetical protein
MVSFEAETPARSVCGSPEPPRLRTSIEVTSKATVPIETSLAQLLHR